MPRKGEVRKREILPDPKYGDKVVAKFVNTIMSRGKKSVAERIVYDTLEIMQQQQRRDPLELFEQAVRNATPMLERISTRGLTGAKEEPALLCV